MVLRLKLALIACASAQVVLAAPLPSCDDETNAHCVGEDADLSPAGISKCLGALEPSSVSQSCTTYLAMMEACKADLADGGVCGAAAMDGEGMPCLVQRTKPEDLTEACRGALPVNELKGLAKFWADGKRALDINEIADLTADDKDTYNRWQKKKKGKKTEKDREREYAVKNAKRERVEKLMTAAVKAAKPATVADAVTVAEAEAKKAVDEDMTGSFKGFTKAQIHGIAKTAFNAYKEEL